MTDRKDGGPDFMRARIKSYNGDLPSYLTDGKVYEIRDYDPIEGTHEAGFYLTADDGEEIYCCSQCCAHLDDGKWELLT